VQKGSKSAVLYLTERRRTKSSSGLWASYSTAMETSNK